MILFAAGCAHRPALSPLPAVPADIPGYVALLNARSTGGGEGTSRARVGAAFLPPARLRLEVLDPGGGTRAVLIAAEGGALYLDPGRRSYRAYPTDAAALEALVGIGTPPALLARLILGPTAVREGLSCAGEGPQTCPLPDGAELRLSDSRIAAAEIRDPRFGTVDVSWDPPDPSSREIPRGTEIRLRTSGATLRLELRELRFSRPEDSLFSLTPPAGFQPGAAPER